MPKEKSKEKNSSAQISAIDFSYLQKVSSSGDVSISCGKNNLQCHSCVLIARAPALFKGGKNTGVAKILAKKGTTSVVLEENKQHLDLDALGCVLDYLYTGKIELPKSITSALHVGVLAQEWKLERLRWHVEARLRTGLDIKNIFEAVVEASELGDEEMKTLCVIYAVGHWVEVTQNMMDMTTGTGKLPMPLFAELVQLQTRPPTVEDQAEEPAEPILDNFKKLYESKEGSDAELVIGGKAKIKVHQPILAARSEQMAALFASGKGKDDKDHLRGLAPASFETLLRFLYYKDDNIDPQAAAELVPFCQIHGLKDLQDACESKIRDNIDPDTVLDILAVAYDKTMSKRVELQQELKEKAIKFIVEELPTLDLEPLRKMDPVIAVDILLACQEKEGGGPAKKVARPSSPAERKVEKTSSKRGDVKEEKVEKAEKKSKK